LASELVSEGNPYSFVIAHKDDDPEFLLKASKVSFAEASKGDCPFLFLPMQAGCLLLKQARVTAPNFILPIQAECLLPKAGRGDSPKVTVMCYFQGATQTV
jgi:hypothetical protein